MSVSFAYSLEIETFDGLCCMFNEFLWVLQVQEESAFADRSIVAASSFRRGRVTVDGPHLRGRYGQPPRLRDGQDRQNHQVTRKPVSIQQQCKLALHFV